MPRSKLATIASWVMNCTFCQPLSGCVLSDLKGKSKSEIIASLSVLSEDGLKRIISIHSECPYSAKLAI